ncbi:c-type cytochrome [Pseudomonas aeruginosa]|jgi:mono/diheme cytochrome c family protein|uniref:Cytochrome C oxidase, cbb3-type, subunit III n=1 Tax=Pseudomonas indica TaxID=137658 RepID=A0A1G8TWR2_9PSED|nr:MULTISPECIES: cytochrome c [Pseudomonas]RUJ25118.1 cytochrome c [Pseudomonas aeruginosa]RUJ43156.1 cytochrome c [Pseudomonas aeruginosa]UCO98120.1 cytochrome c [Pseudomonas lalkuanensis]WAG78979.1 cytochrome c [Pseudomonas furukawaii]SDJ45345.1 Cytochrome C oxidase, cbb3-type, subunit III [Pseudomonas indica]
MKRTIKTLAIASVVGATAIMGVAYFGVVNVGADDPHLAPVHAFLTMVRERSIEVRARDLQVPNLEDEALIRAGAGNYNSMCIGCHLAPGVAETELSKSLYPSPPNLTKVGVDGSPASAFWIIKHGIKATGMPAWGKSMGDQYIWGMVAFLQQLPSLDAAQYRALVASSSGHQHGGGESKMHNHEGQHGDNVSAAGSHHGSAGEDHHAVGQAGDDHHMGESASQEADHHAAEQGGQADESHHAGEEGEAHHHEMEQAQDETPPSSKTHTHADGKEHDHES